jgi:hypothetical protein
MGHGNPPETTCDSAETPRICQDVDLDDLPARAIVKPITPDGFDDHSPLGLGDAGITPSCRICAKTSTTPQASATRLLTKRAMKISL